MNPGYMKKKNDSYRVATRNYKISIVLCSICVVLLVGKLLHMWLW